MDRELEQELEKLKDELKTILPKLAAENPEQISKMAATALADIYQREGRTTAVPCPVCGDTLHVQRMEIDDDKGGIKGSVWIRCIKGCTINRVNYGL